MPRMAIGMRKSVKSSRARIGAASSIDDAIVAHMQRDERHGQPAFGGREGDAASADVRSSDQDLAERAAGVTT